MAPNSSETQFGSAGTAGTFGPWWNESSVRETLPDARPLRIGLNESITERNQLNFATLGLRFRASKYFEITEHCLKLFNL